MKTILTTCIFIALLPFYRLTAQAIAINTNGALPDSSAILDISSTDKGLLIPRMTLEERLQIHSPAQGLLVYQIDSIAGYYAYSGSHWELIGANSVAVDEYLQIGAIDTSSTIPEYNMAFTLFASDTSGILYDSGGPECDYWNNSNYDFEIDHIPGALAIRIVIISIETESPYDSLSIWATNTPAEGLYTYSGTKNNIQLPLLYGNGGGITIQFISNTVNTAQGFMIRWDWIFPTAVDEPAPLAGWYFNKEKLAMRGGINTGGSWDSENTGLLSFSWGRTSLATGASSIAMGRQAQALGTGAVALGDYNYAEGDYALAMGSGSDAIGNSSVALGYGAEALGSISFAFGSITEASGYNSTAGGFLTKAQGSYSTALGYFTEANGHSSVVIGRYNDPIVIAETSITNTTPLFIIGNGSAASPSNALVVRKDGKVGIGTNTPAERLSIGKNTGDAIRIGSYETLRDGGGSTLVTNAMFLPEADDMLDLGSSSKRWQDVWATNGVIQTSDGRDKEAITDLEYGLNVVSQLRPVSYQWKDGPDRSTKLGLIAQEVQAVLPGVVRTTNFVVDESGNVTEVELDRLGINYAALIPVLIRAMQELEEKNARLVGLITNQMMDDELRSQQYQKSLESLEQRIYDLEQLGGSEE